MMLASKQVVQLAREARYGVDPGGGLLFPAFLGGEPPVRPEATVLRTESGQAHFGLATQHMLTPTQQVPALRTLLYDSSAEALSIWTLLAEASGLKKITAGRWEAQAGHHASALLRWWLDGGSYTVPGLRGTLVLTGVVGAPVEIAFTSTGRYQDFLPGATMPSSFLVLPVPVRLCNIGLTVALTGLPVRTPKGVQSLEIQTNTVLTQLTCGRQDEGAWEWRISNVSPSVRFVCEADAAWDWTRYRNIAGRIQCGFGEVGRWAFDFPAMQVAAPAQKVRLESGAFGEEVVFAAVTGGRGAPMTVTRTG